MPSILDHGLRSLGRLGLPGVRRVINWLRPPGGFTDQDAAFEVRFDGHRYSGSLREHIDREIFYLGSYSPAELDFLHQAARRCALDGKPTYFDIGANVGQHSLYMSRRAEWVYAFEPSVRAVRQMRANLEANAITNTTVFPLGLGDADEEASLGSGLEHNSGSRSLLWSLDGHQGEAVQVRHGGRFFAENDLPKIDILKLDVEGFEKKVLSGLHDILVRDRPVIMMELIGPEHCKGGFADEADLRSALYPDCMLYSLTGARRAHLGAFHWNVEEIVCLPVERVVQFGDLITDPTPG